MTSIHKRPDDPELRPIALRRRLAVDPRLDRCTTHRDRALFRDRLARGDPELERDEVEPSHLFRHGMLDQEPGVHLHEIWLVAFLPEDELDRPERIITNRTAEPERLLEEARARGIRGVRRRRLLDDLLVIPLYRALALEDMNQVSVPVARDLDLEVTRPENELLEQDPVVFERPQRLGLRERELGVEVVATIDPAHPLPAATGARLDEERIPHAVRLAAKRTHILAMKPRNERDARFARDPLRLDLRAHLRDPLGAWADPDVPGVTQRRARTGFSDRNPYPGWIASARELAAASTIRAGSR